MKIAILGSGNVGSSLARAWIDCGHEVIFGVRDPESDNVREAREYAPSAHVSGFPEACAQASVVVVTVPYGAAAETLAEAGNLHGKLIIDATNPIGPGLTILPNLKRSGIEELARQFDDAHFVKAFNSVGYEVMRNPIYGDRRAVMHFCGDNHGAKELAETLIREVGFDPLDAGPLAAARHLENLALLWIHLAHAGQQGRTFAYSVLHRGANEGS